MTRYFTNEHEWIDVDGDTATVLVFVDQTTTGNDRPEPTVSASAVRVGLKKVRDKWLIERFDPV